MESLAFLTPTGRTSRAPFALGVIVVYVLIFASGALLSTPGMTRSSVAPFAVVQLGLTYSWYVLHARRLNDAELGTGSARAIAILYGLGVVLLVLLAQFASGIGAEGREGPKQVAGLLIVMFLIALINGDANTMGLFFYAAMIILVVILMPLLIALGYSIWAGTRASAPAPAPMSAPPAAGAAP